MTIQFLPSRCPTLYRNPHNILFCTGKTRIFMSKSVEISRRTLPYEQLQILFQFTYGFPLFFRLYSAVIKPRFLLFNFALFLNQSYYILTIFTNSFSLYIDSQKVVVFISCRQNTTLFHIAYFRIFKAFLLSYQIIAQITR